MIVHVRFFGSTLQFIRMGQASAHPSDWQTSNAVVLPRFGKHPRNLIMGKQKTFSMSEEVSKRMISRLSSGIFLSGKQNSNGQRSQPLADMNHEILVGS